MVPNRLSRLLQSRTRIATWNAFTLYDCEDPVNAAHHAALVSLTQQLSKLSIGLCGVQESRLLGEGEQMVLGTGWKMVHSGRADIRQWGVALLMDRQWQRAFTGSWTAHSPRLLSARFQLQNGITITTIVAYAPTNSSSDADKEQFGLLLASMLGSLPKRDLVIVLVTSMPR